MTFRLDLQPGRRISSLTPSTRLSHRACGFPPHVSLRETDRGAPQAPPFLLSQESQGYGAAPPYDGCGFFA